MHLFEDLENKLIYNSEKHLFTSFYPRRNIYSFYNPHGFARYYTKTSAMYLLKTASQCSKTVLPKRAHDVLETLLSLQCTDSSSVNFGLWHFDAEKDIASEQNPDGNLASFIGVPLFILLLEYPQLFSSDELCRIESALKRACIYILHRRTDFTATHIIYSEVFLTAACGEKFNIPEFVHHGETQLKKLYGNAMLHNSFNTYNSPNYDFYALSEIHFICRYVKNKDILHRVEKLNELHWGTIALHYHAKSGEVAAPSTRNTSQNGLLPPSIKSFLADIGSMHKYSGSVLDFRSSVPPKFLGYFKKERTAFEQKVITDGYAFPYFNSSQVASTLIHPDYALGSFSKNIIWYETQPFFAYFGSFSSPFSASLTVLHDGVPFASSESALLQYKNYMLGHITFATNRSDKHINSDPTGGRICACDLRIRFILNGDTSNVKYHISKNKISVYADNISMNFRFDYADFDSFALCTHFEKNTDSLCFDLIIHSGKQRIIDFKKLQTAIAAWSFSISSDAQNASLPKTSCKFKKDYLISQAALPGNIFLQLKSLYKPDTHENIQTQSKHYINGAILERYAEKHSSDIANYSYIDKFAPSFPIDLLTGNGNYISNQIDNIPNTDIKFIIEYVKELLKKIDAENINLSMKKRIAIQSLVNSYELFKKYDVTFNIIIPQFSHAAAEKITEAQSFEEIAFAVLQQLCSLDELYIKKAGESAASLSNQVMQIIDNEFKSPNLSLKYISEKLNVPIYALSRDFKKSAGIGYNEYLTKKRMEYAKHLISTTALGIEEISLKCGYFNLSAFRRTFKGYTSMTVSDFKKMLMI